MSELIVPDWPAPARVRALVTTRSFGDLGTAEGRAKLRALVPAEPAWLKQVHGTTVVDARGAPPFAEADASVARADGAVCVVMAADCMPVLLADEAGGAVAAAHAGWRGLCAGVVEAALARIGSEPQRLIAWLGPAIGPRAYEVGDEVREAFVARAAEAQRAFAPARPGHWMLDLYAVARQRLTAAGVTRIYGGAHCTFTEKDRFFSFRRERTSARMAAAIWFSA